MSDRVLIVRFSAIGDCVMAAWAVTALKLKYPELEIVWAVQDVCAPVIDPQLAEVVVADRSVWRKQRRNPATWSAQRRVFGDLRSRKFDVGFDLQGHSKTALCLRMSGAKSRLTNRGTDAFAKWLNTQVDAGKGERHEVLKSLRLLETRFGKLELPDLPMLPHGTGARSTSLVTIQTGAGEERKRLPVVVWESVVRRLQREGFEIAFLGGSSDPEIHVEGTRNLVGKLSLSESMETIAASGLHLAADTGTAHLAAAYGVPTVAVFGPTDPERFRPFGQAVSVVQVDDLNATSPDSVIDSALSLLGGVPSVR